MTDAAKAEQEKWQIEGDVRTLKEAEIIKADPKRMKAAMAGVDEEMQAIMKVHASGSMEMDAQKRFPNTYKKKGE